MKSRRTRTLCLQWSLNGTVKVILCSEALMQSLHWLYDHALQQYEVHFMKYIVIMTVHNR